MQRQSAVPPRHCGVVAAVGEGQPIELDRRLVSCFAVGDHREEMIGIASALRVLVQDDAAAQADIIVARKIELDCRHVEHRPDIVRGSLYGPSARQQARLGIAALVLDSAEGAPGVDRCRLDLRRPLSLDPRCLDHA